MDLLIGNKENGLILVGLFLYQIKPHASLSRDGWNHLLHLLHFT